MSEKKRQKKRDLENKPASASLPASVRESPQVSLENRRKSP